MITFFYDSYRLILFFLLPGMGLGAIYDVFRILRIARTDSQGSVLSMLLAHFKIQKPMDIQSEQKKQKAEWYIVFIEDFIFCILASLTELLLFYHLNGGVIRVYAIFISVLGFVLYKITLGRLIMFLAKNMILIFRRVLYFLLCVALTPPIFIGRRIHRFWKKQKNKHPKHKKEKEEEMT